MSMDRFCDSRAAKASGAVASGLVKPARAAKLGQKGARLMAAATGRPKGWRLLKAALSTRKSATMLAFGFSSGLPFALLVGTLNAWLGEVGVNLATIGVLSWIGLAYAFKFLWSPMVDRVPLPLLDRLGPPQELDRPLPVPADRRLCGPRRDQPGDQYRHLRLVRGAFGAGIRDPGHRSRRLADRRRRRRHHRSNFCRPSTNSAIAPRASSAARLRWSWPRG